MTASACVCVCAETYYILDGFTYRELDYGVSISGWDYSSDVLRIPQLLGGERVVAIDDFAFYKDDGVTAVDFSNASYLTTIGKMAFCASGLTGELELTPSINSIGVGAFQGCSGVTSVVLNANTDLIPNQCFKDCVNLSEIEILAPVSKIGAYAFQNCASLESITLNKYITSIDATAFQNDDIILNVYKDTYAHQYAVENKIDHIVLDGYGLGDVNGDGVVDILDASEIQKYAAESTDFTDEQFELGDINKDGYCDVIDALLVQKSVIGAYEIPQNIIRY